MSYQIAAGWNNAAGLADVNTLGPVGGEKLNMPRAFPLVNAGTRRYRGDLTSTISGTVVQRWDFTAAYYDQYIYVKETFCGTGRTYSGKVTIRTRLYDTDTYANYNAVLEVPFQSEIDTGTLGGFGQFSVLLRIVAAL